MFFNAHAFYSLQKSHGVASPLRIVGNLLPDSALTGVIGWADLHDKKTIRAFVKTLPKNYVQLGLGLGDHYELDIRSHDIYEGGGGYAFSHQTAELRELVSQACGITLERARGLAHNFIESGVDINLLRSDNTIQGKVRQALHTTDINAIAQYVANFFGVDTAETRSRLAVFKDLIAEHDLKKEEEWMVVWEKIALLLLNKPLDKQAAKKAIVLAVKLTANDYTKVVAI